MKKVCLRVLPFSENEAVEPKKLKQRLAEKCKPLFRLAGRIGQYTLCILTSGH